MVVGLEPFVLRRMGISRPLLLDSTGAGTGINGAVYSELARSPSFKAGMSTWKVGVCWQLREVDVIGRSRAPYDVYPRLSQQNISSICIFNR